MHFFLNENTPSSGSPLSVLNTPVRAIFRGNTELTEVPVNGDVKINLYNHIQWRHNQKSSKRLATCKMLKLLTHHYLYLGQICLSLTKSLA